jgi:signal peptidase I
MPVQPAPTDSDSPVIEFTSHDGTIIDTLQSLIIAFVLAMTFRGFVTEGFVIPTGSMAPTLMGAHLLLHSDQTGITFPVGLDPTRDQNQQLDIPMRNAVDPMLGPKYGDSLTPNSPIKPRLGDRILVLKCLYPFMEPRRYDVVVFKNPTDPVGDAGNYIQRLLGLPDEEVWIADGDVFSKPDGSDRFTIRRKPEHVQRAVWQLIHQSDYVPINPQSLDGRVYEGPPWQGDGWQTTVRDQTGVLRGTRAYRCDSAELSELNWRNDIRAIDDWAAYNMLAGRSATMPVSDVRISAAVAPDSDQFKATLELQARGHVFEFVIQQASAMIRMRRQGANDDWTMREASIAARRAGRVFDVEFWNVDQALSIFVDGERVVHLDYDWTPLERLQFATGDASITDVKTLLGRRPIEARVALKVEGSPVTLYRVRLDRDLYYRADQLRNQKNGPQSGPSFGSHPDENAAILGPDQFMMCGDNSPCRWIRVSGVGRIR